MRTPIATSVLFFFRLEIEHGCEHKQLENCGAWTWQLKILTIYQIMMLCFSRQPNNMRNTNIWCAKDKNTIEWYARLLAPANNAHLRQQLAYFGDRLEDEQTEIECSEWKLITCKSVTVGHAGLFSFIFLIDTEVQSHTRARAQCR